ncbi:MAG: transglycosylase family protein [Actinobacteria bacterium]|nr:transglycosylase family protein [Actinomycetota bacterium]
MCPLEWENRTISRLIAIVLLMLAASAQLDARISFDPPPPPPEPAPVAKSEIAPPPVTVVPAEAVAPLRTRRITFPGVWGRLSHCESSGDPRAVSRDRQYFGLFQFSLDTWHFLGYSGNPADASPATQLTAAKRLQAMRGWNQWPRCARRLGLL